MEQCIDLIPHVFLSLMAQRHRQIGTELNTPFAFGISMPIVQIQPYIMTVIAPLVHIAVSIVHYALQVGQVRRQPAQRAVILPFLQIVQVIQAVTQIRACASALLQFAKQSGIPVIIIGHITKEGTLAGPKVLEHIVDAVLQFEGDRHYLYRILRCIKNRFGSTAELGIYEMTGDGLRAVENPSEQLLGEGNEGMSGVAIAAAVEGVRPFLIETQALVSTAAYGVPQRSATGFDLRRLNMLLAVLEKRVGFKLAQKDVFLNIAGGIRVTDPAIDLSVISAVLSSNVDTGIEPLTCMAGEVGLSGEIRPVTRITQRVSEAARLGFRRIIIPAFNSKSLDASKYAIEIIPAARVEDALRHLFG